jgi:magnesium-transporting ATPase (P-type)
MPVADDLASNSLLISSGVAMIAVFLGLRQWYEWRGRESELSELDHLHFVRQDVRRGLGVAVMLVIAAGLYVGSRIPPKVAGRANLTFIEVWLAIVGLIIVMLLLAFVDWVSTRIYARRQSRSMARERLQILRETLRRSRDERASDHEPPPAD